MPLDSNTIGPKGTWFPGTPNTNDLTEVVPQLLMQALDVLRQNCVMPRLVNTSYGTEARRKGATIEIPVATGGEVTDVTPAMVHPTPQKIEFEMATIKLDKWKKFDFYLTDADFGTIQDGTIPRVANTAVVRLAEAVNADILATYKKFSGHVGTAGLNPFVNYKDGTTAANLKSDASRDLKTSTDFNILQTGIKLADQLCPASERSIVVDPQGFGRAMGLEGLQNRSWSSRATVIETGKFNDAFGYDWSEDTQVPQHKSNAGDAEAKDATNFWSFSKLGTKGEKSITVKSAGALPDAQKFPVVGDLFTIAGSTLQYTVLTAPTTAANTAVLGIYPSLESDNAADVKLSFVGTHRANLAFNKDAIGFASRPLALAQVSGAGVLIDQITDPQSGLTMRLEVSRLYKEMVYTFDILYGVDVIRPEYGIRILGQ